MFGNHSSTAAAVDHDCSNKAQSDDQGSSSNNHCCFCDCHLKSNDSNVHYEKIKDRIEKDKNRINV